MILRKVFCPSLVLPLGLLVAPALHAEAISTRPPVPYEEKLAGLLIPADKLLQELPEAPAEAEEGWVLLDEEVQHILPDGRRLIVEHRMTRALTDAGAEQLGRAVRSYQTHSQKMHLVLARTIQADGRKQPVKPDAMFLQTPQREADDALYNDTGELVLIFPGVKAGATIEWIVVKEELKPRITGHYTSWLTFDLGWPMHLARAIVELPRDLATRLQVINVGRGVPEARKEEVPGDTTRWTWARHQVPATKDEPGRAPYLQTGPIVRLTTLKDWGEFLRWYVPLANRRTQPGPKLAAEVEAMTKGAGSPREILDILTSRVANDVRYVGLEFGDSDLEPHAVSEVWEHQYGDCKDKASLLRAMLLLKGIPAHLALVNTDHLGRIEKRSPDFRDFDHVIVVAELPDGPVFCDPTVSGAPAGMITPHDADRDVLLVKEPEQWMRTPPQDAGRYTLDFDAKVALTGEISGWATLEASGYMGVRYADLEARGTKQQLKERLSNRVAGCFPGARVVDVKPMPRSTSDKYQVQAYFVVAPTGTPSLPFPLDPGTLPEIGDGENRETDLFLWRETVTTKSTFALPEGFRAATLPGAQTLKTPTADISASWEQEGATVRCTYSYVGKSSRVPPADCKAFAQTLTSLRSWLSQPVTLEAGKGTAPATPRDELGEFPLMPSAEGQIALVNERFPTSGNAKLRRLALEKSLTYFPKDKRLQFNAQVQLAYLDTVEGEHEAALQRLRAPLESLRGSVDALDAALGDYIMGITLKNKGDAAGALAVFTKIVETKGVDAFRRAWSQYQRSLILVEKADTAGALAAVEAGLALEDGAEGVLFRQLAELLLTRKEGVKLAASLEGFLGKETSPTAEVLTSLARLSHDWAGTKPDEASELIEILNRLGDLRRFGQEVAEAHEEATSAVKTGASLGKVQARLRQWIKDHAADLPAWQIPDTLKTEADFTKAIEVALAGDDNVQNAVQLVRLSVESLARFAPGAWYPERLFRATSYGDYLDRLDDSTRPPPVLVELLDLCDLLPRDSDTNQDGRLLRARMLVRMSKLEEAGKVLHAMTEDPLVVEAFKVVALTRYADNCMARKDRATALTTWHRLAGSLQYHSVPGELFRAALAALECGREEEALRFVALLRKAKPSVIDKTQGAAHIHSFLEFAKDDASAKAWWAASAKWWPEWLAFARKHGEGSADDEKEIRIAVIPDLKEFGAALGEDGRAGRKSEVFAALSELAHAARWHPLFASELATMGQYFSTLGLQDAVPDFRKVIIAIHDADAGSPMLDSAHIWAVISLVDGDGVERVATEVQEFLKGRTKRDAVSAAMVRLWSLAAVRTGKDLPAVAGLLEGLLATPPENDTRHQTFASLAEVYRKLGRTEDEKVLLKKELENPVTLKGAEALDPLRERLEFLLEGGGSGDGPALAAKAWLAAKTPSWYDYARPRDLSDPKAADPDEAIQAGSQLSSPEAVRLCLLIAQDPSQPDSRRLDAISRLGWHTGDVAASDDEAAAWITAIIEEKSVPRRVRAMALDSFLRQAFLMDHRGRITRLGNHTVLNAFTEDEGVHFKAIRRYAVVAPNDLDGSLRAGEDLLANSLNYFSAETLQRMIRRLAFGNRIEDAQKLAKGFGSAKFDERIARDKSSHQLAALKSINLAKKLNPVQDALRALYLSRRPSPQGKSPLEIPWRASLELNLPEAEATVVREAWVRDNTWSRDRLDFWFDVTGDLPHVPETEALSLALLALALEKTPDDLLRAQLITRCSGFVDIDDAGTRTRLETVLQPHRNLTDAPLTKDALRVHDLVVRLRTGASGDAFATLDAISDLRMKQQARWSVLRACIGNADKAGLKRILDNMDTDELLSPMNASMAMTAYRLLGMSDEAELASERAGEALYDFLLQAWSMPWALQPGLALEKAREIGDASLVPASFSSDMAAYLKHERERLFFLTKDACLRKQWEDCARHGAAGRAKYPTFYDFHGHEGVALARLGRKEEAIPLLKTFLSHSHNDPDAAEAKALLQKLEE